MNLPLSAVTPSIPKSSSSCISQEHSDYMNVEPKDIHIYQNTSILSMNHSGDVSKDVGEISDTGGSPATVGPSILPATSQSDGLASSKSPAVCSESSLQQPSQSHNLNQSNNSQAACHATVLPHSNPINQAHDSSTASDFINPSTSTSINSANNTSSSSRSSKFLSRGDDIRSLSPGRRREGLAESSFVERKYGLIFTDDRPGCASTCHNDTKSSDLSRSSRLSRSNH